MAPECSGNVGERARDINDYRSISKDVELDISCQANGCFLQRKLMENVQSQSVLV